MTQSWTNYTTRGYSDSDGLGEGQWEPVPGTAGLQRWVGQLEPTIPLKRPVSRGNCVDCNRECDMRAARCRACKGRQWSQKRWADAS